MTDNGLISTDEAAALLGVKTETIYTYVSRGRLEPLRKPGVVASWFRREDVERLAGSRHSRRPDQSTRRATIATAISDIDGKTCRYRGHEPTHLVGSYSFEQVAELLWTGTLPNTARWESDGAGIPISLGVQGAEELLPLGCLRVSISMLAAADHLRFGRPPEALIVTGRHLITNMVATLPELGASPSDSSIAASLWARLSPEPPTPEQLVALDTALIVIADHSVAPSTLAARIAASYGSDLYGCVEAGLAILAGAWHGGRAISAESMLEDIEKVGDAEVVVGELFRLGTIPCLGQPRYTTSDPRTTLIAEAVEVAMPGNATSQAFADVQRITRDRALPQPSVELALAVLARAFGFTKGASEAIFAVGRSAGWVAHAIEVYQGPSAGPPQFTYIGVDPVPVPVRNQSTVEGGA